MTKTYKRCPLWILLFALLHSSRPVLSVEENLYAILGVKRTAKTKEIKKAYRRKALESHPDKNLNVPPAEAAAAFQRVVQAFEILSDKKARKHYDRTGSTTTRNSGGARSRGFQFQFKTGQRRRPQQQQGPKRTPLKDQFQVQEAMGRVLHIASLRQLKTIMLKDEEVHVTKKEHVVEEQVEAVFHANETMTISKKVNVTKITTTTFRIEHETVERNLLIAFVTAGNVETMLDENLVFPYPYAGLSKQGIWWEEFLQTVKVRYHHSTKLTRFFDIPHRDNLQAPVFVFVKMGNTLKDYKRLQATQRAKFTHWMWNNLIVENVKFINRHKNEVDIWWVHDDQVKYHSSVPSDHVATMDAKLSHTFWIRDSRVNKHLTPEEEGKLLLKDRLSENSTLQVIQIVNDDKNQTFDIGIKACMDLSTTCEGWKLAYNCTSNDSWAQSYTNKYCRKSCGKCTAAQDFRAKQERDLCRDHEGFCQIWARQGECEKNKEFMVLRCPYSCKVCDPNKNNQNTKQKERNDSTKRRKKNQRKSVVYSSSDEEDFDIDSSSDEEDFSSNDSDDVDADEFLSFAYSNDDTGRDDSSDDEFAFAYSSEDSDEDETVGEGHSEL